MSDGSSERPGTIYTAVISPSAGGPSHVEMAFFENEPGEPPILMEFVQSDQIFQTTRHEFGWILIRLSKFHSQFTNVLIVDNLPLDLEHISQFLRANMANGGFVAFSPLRLHKDPQSPIERAFRNAVASRGEE